MKYRNQKFFELDFDIDKLKEKRIACWCASEKCHADLLAKLADMTYKERWEWAKTSSREPTIVDFSEMDVE